MNAPVPHIKIDPLEVLRVRAEARAFLVECGLVDLHTAVDELAADAQRDGIDTDTAQAIIASQFRKVRNG